MLTATHSPLYLLINRYSAGDEGVMYPEMTRAALIKGIAEGQYEDLVQVIELHEGRYRDVSRDIADEIVSGDFDLTVRACADFIDRHGWDSAAIIREDRAEARAWRAHCSSHVGVL